MKRASRARLGLEVKIGDDVLFYLTRLVAYHELRIPGRQFPESLNWTHNWANLFAAPIMIRKDFKIRAFIIWYLFRHKMIKLNTELKIPPRIIRWERPVKLTIE